MRATRAAARHPHLEPHARGARRAEAALPVSVDRLSVVREGAGDRARSACRDASARLAEQVTAIVQELRTLELYKVPGVSETLDWVAALVALDRDDARCRRRRRDARRRAEGEGRHRRGPRRSGGARSRAADRSASRHVEPHVPHLLENLLIFGRLLRARGHRRARRPADRRRRGARARRPRRARRGLPHVPRAARPSPGQISRSSIARSTRSGARIGAGRSRRRTASADRQRDAADRDRSGIRRRRTDWRQTGDAGRRDGDAAAGTRSRRGATRRRSPTRTSPSSPTDELARGARGARRASPGARRAPHAAMGSRAAGRASICGARSPTACAPAATSSSCRGAAGASGRGRSSCSATSAARWSATRACCCTSRTRVTRRHQRVEAFLFSTRLTRITRQLRAPATGRRARGGVASGARLVGRHAHRRRAQRVPSALGPPRAARRPGGAAHLRRLGSRRSGASCATRSRGCSEAAIG